MCCVNLKQKNTSKQSKLNRKNNESVVVLSPPYSYLCIDN